MPAVAVPPALLVERFTVTVPALLPVRRMGMFTTPSSSLTTNSEPPITSALTVSTASLLVALPMLLETTTE